MSSTASLTRTSMCSPRASPFQRARCRSGKRAVRPRNTERTVAPGVKGSSNTRRPEPSPPTNVVTHDTASTGTVPAARCDVVETAGMLMPSPQRTAAGAPGPARRRPLLLRVLGLEDSDHVGIGQGGRVAQRAALRDVAQQAPHDLAAAGLGQLRRVDD